VSTSQVTGFDLLSNEACARAGAAPLLDLAMDAYSRQGSAPPTNDPLGTVSWVLSQPNTFLQTLLSGLFFLLQTTAVADNAGAVIGGTSSTSNAYSSAILSNLASGLSYLASVLTGLAPTAGFLQSGALDRGAVVMGAPVDFTAAPSGLGVGGLSAQLNVVLGTTTLGTLDASVTVSTTGSLAQQSFHQTFMAPADPYNALWQLACALRDPTLPRPLPLLSFGTLSALDRHTGATVSTPYFLDLGAWLAFADSLVSSALPFSYSIPRPVSEAAVYGVQRYAQGILFGPTRPPCPAVTWPSASPSPGSSPSPTPTPSLSPGSSPSTTPTASPGSGGGGGGGGASAAAGSTFAQSTVVGIAVGAGVGGCAMGALLLAGAWELIKRRAAGAGKGDAARGARGGASSASGVHLELSVKNSAWNATGKEQELGAAPGVTQWGSK